ncbi:hypothetical protein SKAU_G00106890 [Synaphobranchus kaupii]|uniref:Death-inducer obliterator 1 n=1 Tax=Synaphobranchus kaupii TaxID=118154 RepID=A0A9Q1FZP1_SYNKA|nr:hypothetical protein SKAU_G00106890 [Synaphobranchus kaupii]
MPPSGFVTDGTSSDQADSEELTLKELQDLLKKRCKRDPTGLQRETDSLRKEDEENSQDKLAEPEAIIGMPAETSAGGTSQGSMSTHKIPKSRRGRKPIMKSEEEEEFPDQSDNESHYPDALYCICQQKHNNRFMICCDRCEEWFHGDCVGITEARGRLLERNGEDYSCPSCTLQRSQTAATKSSEETKQASSWAEESHSSCQAVPSTGMELGHREEQGIKGKIERATNPSEKKKIKIFQPVEETSTMPKCIGPGCDKCALPDSVYCGTECILNHAAAAMKSITKVKEPPPKPRTQKKLATKSVPKGRKRSLSERTRRRSLESCGRAEEDESSSEVEAVVEQDQTTPLWSSDHNCITVNPENTTAIPSAVFYKSSGKESEEIEGKKESAQLQQKTPLSFTFPGCNKKTPIMGDQSTKRTKLVSQSASCDGDSKNSTFPPNKKCSPAPTFTSQPFCPQTSRRHTLDALRFSKITDNIPSQLPLQQHLPPGPSAACLVSLASAAPSKAYQTQPNSQIRHNIRRSLTEILYKRVTDSDDVHMSERNVGKLALCIEKEMYELFLNTDIKYKNKYRSIMFNLKDPKNKGLFFQVVSGQVTPFKLVRLSQEELLSKDVPGWMHSERTEILEHSPKAQAGQLKRGLKQEQSASADIEDSSPASDGVACISATPPSPCMASAPGRSPTPVPVNSRQPNVASHVTDVFSQMLNDTTAEHRTHLFNLNCKICTGRMPAEEEPVPKKSKNSSNKKAEPKAKPLSRNSRVRDYLGDDSSGTPLDSAMDMMESPASPDDTSCTVTLSEPVTIPAVPSVVISGRDPRTASYRPPTIVTSAVPTVSSIVESRIDITPVLPPPPPPPPFIPKSILLKPTSSHMRFFTTGGSSSSMMDSHSPPGGDTALFLSKQEVQWKGFINMPSIAKFVTKAYLVSGSFEFLEEDLPDTIQIGGRISPDIVWDYVAKIKTSLTKELCLIRFHPATEEEEVAYISLFSYFNSRGRFGVVANNNRRIKDLYLIPLGAKARIPSKLLPIEGPGLETNRPNLLLGLAICQKPKCSGAHQGEDDEEKCSKFQTGKSDDTGLSNLLALSHAEKHQDKNRMYNPEILIRTTPPGSPSSVSSSDSSSSSLSTSLLLPLKASAPVTTNSGKGSSSPTTASSITPLQTILKTLFGKNKMDSSASLPPSEQNLVKVVVPPAPLLDPIVQQFGHLSKEKLEEDKDNRLYRLEEFHSGIGYGVEEDEDDRPYDPEEEYNTGMSYGVEEEQEEDDDNRPYDPEEEYNPGMDYGVEEDDDDRPYDPEEEYNQGMGYGVEQEEDEDNRPYDPEEEYNPGMDYEVEPAQKIQASKLSKAFSDEEVAYDPEDETIFEEVKSSVNDNLNQTKGKISPKIDCVSENESLTLTEQRKMLEELNKQIEEHTQQLAEQEEALRQQRAAVGVSLAHFSVSDALMSPPLKPLLAKGEFLQLGREKELVAKTPPAPVINSRRDPRQNKDPQQAVANQRLTSDRIGKDRDIEDSVEQTMSLKPDHISQSPKVAQPESVIYLDAGSSEISNTPLKEKIELGMNNDFLQDSALQQKIQKISVPQIDSSPRTNKQNSASVLKIEELSSNQSNHPKLLQTLPGSKPIQMPYRSILRNKTSQRSSELPGISHDISPNNISMEDTSESTMSAVRVQSPDFRGSEKMPRSIPLRSLHKSSPVQESPLLQGESDRPQFRDSSKFQPSVACPPYQNRRDEKMQIDNSCRQATSAMLVPRGPRHSSPMGQKGPPAEFDLTFRSSHKSSPVEESPLLQGESDQPQFRDSGSKPIQMPYRSILQNKTSQRSSRLPGIFHDISPNNISMEDTYESTMSAVGVQSPDFRGSEKMPRSIPFRSSHRSSQGEESPLLQRENDRPQFRDSFQPSVACPPYQNRRDEKMQIDNSCRQATSAMFVPRGPHPSPMRQKGPPAEFDLTRSSLLPNNVGQRDLSPDRFIEGHCSPPPLDLQNDSHWLGHNAPCPSFNFSESRGPRSRQIYNRGPRLTNVHGSRVHLPHHKFLDHRSQKPLLGTLSLDDEQQCNSVSYEQHMEKNQVQTPHIYIENEDSSQTHYSSPVGETGGRCFHPPQHFGTPRVPSSHLHNQRVPLGQYRSFENQKGPQLSKLRRQRALPPSQFGGPQDDQDNFAESEEQLNFGLDGPNHTLVERPLRRSGPLLPTPIEGPIFLPHHMGNRPDYHRKDWRHSPDMISGVKGDSELHNNGSRTRMFGGYHHDEVDVQVPSCVSMESLQELSEGRRRERDASHSRLWDRNSSKYWNREQEWDYNSGREVDKHRDGDDNDNRHKDHNCERDRDGDRDWTRREFDRERSRIRDRNKDQECERYLRDGRRVQSRGRDRGRHRDRCDGRDKGRDRDDGRDKGRDRDDGRDKDWDRRERCKRKEKGNELLSEALESEKHA